MCAFTLDHLEGVLVSGVSWRWAGLAPLDAGSFLVDLLLRPWGVRGGPRGVLPHQSTTGCICPVLLSLLQTYDTV